MTKKLIIGLATVAVTGATFLASSMYAATGMNTLQSIGHMRRDPQTLISTLSGKVSPEALTALNTLMTRHKAEMDDMRSSTDKNVDKTQMQAKKTAFKAEMDLLLTKYPDLKAAMPAIKMGMRGGEHGNKEADAIIATLSATTQAELTNIHDMYEAKKQALKVEEQSKIDVVLIKFPDVRAKLDALKLTQMPDRKGRGHHDGDDDKETNDY
ncbi:hypothetical protein H7169_03065 [Candidatus Gracilibacteria bacterium]|nr:hypothetical protein [Candidatus Gracilibacteria bacterium]